MAAMKLLLAAVSLCFLGGVVSITDKEFKDLLALVQQQATMIEKLKDEMDGEINVSRFCCVKTNLFKPNTKTVIVIAGLQATTLDLRVTILENGVTDGNSSVADLEQRVETLEKRAADHETRMSSTESALTDLEDTTVDHETRLTAAEENIQGFQITDIDLEERVTALEESDGSNDTNATVGFDAILTPFSTTNFTIGSAVLFNKVLLNEGDGYDRTTGTFTVPPGRGGLYYFSIYLTIGSSNYGNFGILINDELWCSAYTNQVEIDHGAASCNVVAEVSDGDTVQVIYPDGNDSNPLLAMTSFYLNGFTGFRI